MTTNDIVSGRYRILGIIGTGGMSIVYKARDEKNGRIVALKVLKDEFQENVEFVRRFRHEALAASQMQHPNIVKLYSVGSDGDVPYLVMEYVEGRTLKQVIEKEGRLKSERAVTYALKILAALDHAHRNHIIHRDIKPQNILVDNDDNIKVADFGIARLVNASTKTLSDSNSVMGSVHYVSPEQANAEPVDEKSDLYSMGIVLYEMLTGTVPFDGETPVAIALKQVSELPRSMRTYYRDIPKSLDEVVMKALEKTPQLRYKSAAAMAKDLKRALKLPRGGFVNSPSGFYGHFMSYAFRNGINAVLVALSCITVLSIVIYGFVKVTDILYGVEVPYVIGKSSEEAAETIRSSHMTYTLEENYSSVYAEGTIMAQLPEGYTRSKRGRSVTLTVSKGTQPVMLPDTVGMTRVNALELLAEYGFPAVSIQYGQDAEKEIDTVLAQSPQSGLVSSSESVILTVNSERVAMPFLEGRTEQNAIDTLEALNLTAEVIYGYSMDEKPGTVIMQSIPAYSDVVKGTNVVICVTLDLPDIYYASYSMRAPLSMNVRIVVKSPSGSENEVYNKDVEAGDIISLDIEDTESGEHTVDIYFDGVLTISETKIFE